MKFIYTAKDGLGWFWLFVHLPKSIVQTVDILYMGLTSIVDLLILCGQISKIRVLACSILPSALIRLTYVKIHDGAKGNII